MLPLQHVPENICILRLSSLGDVCHTLPVIRTLQAHWPQTPITWIIGKPEHALLGDIPNIEFIVFDKSRSIRALWSLRRTLKRRSFAILLHMQTSLRSNLIGLNIPAKIKLGFDFARAKELQWLVTNQRIDTARQQHQIDALFGFTKALGIDDHVLHWGIPIPEAAKEYCEMRLPGTQPILTINPCSNPSRRIQRNWNVQGYAAVSNYAVEKLGLRVALCGGSSTMEQEFGKQICARARHPLINLIGQTTLKQLLAILDKSSVLISTDSGPAHIATAVGTPVVGLYAVTNPLQTGPYLSLNWVANKYPQAAEREYSCPLEMLPWGIRVHTPEAMNCISANEVIERLTAALKWLDENT